MTKSGLLQSAAIVSCYARKGLIVNRDDVVAVLVVVVNDLCMSYYDCLFLASPAWSTSPYFLHLSCIKHNLMKQPEDASEVKSRNDDRQGFTLPFLSHLLLRCRPSVPSCTPQPPCLDQSEACGNHRSVASAYTLFVTF